MDTLDRTPFTVLTPNNKFSPLGSVPRKDMVNYKILVRDVAADTTYSFKPQDDISPDDYMRLASFIYISALNSNNPSNLESFPHWQDIKRHFVVVDLPGSYSADISIVFNPFSGYAQSFIDNEVQRY